MAGPIDLSDLDPFSPTQASTAQFASSRAPSSSRPSPAPTPGSSSTIDSLSFLSELNLGVTSTRTVSSSGQTPLGVPARAPTFASTSAASNTSPIEIPIERIAGGSRHGAVPSPHASRTQPQHPARSPPPRRLSSLMDLGEQSTPALVSPPISTSPTFEPFHPLPGDNASRRMRQASGDDRWDTSSLPTRNHRERTVSAEWGDFQAATTATIPSPPLPRTRSSASPASSQTLPPVQQQRKVPSPRRSSTSPFPPPSATTLSAYHLKNLPPPPQPPSAIDPFNQPVQLTGIKPGISQILNETIAEGLRPCLAPRLRISSNWTLLYSLEQDGTSLLTLFTRVTNGLRSKSGGFVLVVRTDRGETFGAYLSDALRPEEGVTSSTGFRSSRNGLNSVTSTGGGGNRVWTGDGTSFLFTTLSLPPTDPRMSPLIKTFPPTFRNTYFQHASLHSGIAIGGGNDGNFGLWIDERLERGWTGKSETFGNEPLTMAAANHNGTTRNTFANSFSSTTTTNGREEDVGKFEVVGIECWAVGS
ncbi:Oxr1p [Sporobolomyces koalae]|uniref:Oxr1p n=1 Tax=Sporobolomyces koalae TaxID=500713 RepID=UPI00316CCDAB